MTPSSGRVCLLARQVAALKGLGDDERGVVAIVAALVVTIIILAAALAVDIAGRVTELRRDQAVADLAALDASRGASVNYQTLACASATRNHLTTCTGPKQYVTATASTVNGNAGVNVVVQTPYSDFFGGTSSHLVATAFAALSTKAQFSVGSNLLEIQAGFGKFGVASSKIDLVGYNGLASGNVTLAALGTQLGFGALSPDNMLNQQVSVGDLVQASSVLLSASNPAASSSLSGLYGALLANLTTDAATKVKLGDALGLQQGSGVGLGTSVNLLNAVRGSLQIANKEAGIALNLGIANVANVSLTGLVPPTVSVLGPVGITATNTQVTLTMNVAVNISVLFVPVLNATLPITLTLGGATGSLDAIHCSGAAPDYIQLGTTFQTAQLTIAPTSVTVLGLGGSTTLLSGTIGVPFSGPTPPETQANRVTNAGNWTTNADGSYNASATPVTASSGGMGTPTSNFTGVVGLLTPALLVAAIGPAAIVTAATTALSGFGIHVGPSADYLGITGICNQPGLMK